MVVLRRAINADPLRKKKKEPRRHATFSSCPLARIQTNFCNTRVGLLKLALFFYTTWKLFSSKIRGSKFMESRAIGRKFSRDERVNRILPLALLIFSSQHFDIEEEEENVFID